MLLLFENILFVKILEHFYSTSATTRVALMLSTRPVFVKWQPGHTHIVSMMVPEGPSSSNMQIVPALPVGAPQVLNPRDGPEPEARGFQDAQEDVQEEGLVLMGRPAPSTPRNFPQPGSFIESSQAVIAR